MRRISCFVIALCLMALASRSAAAALKVVATTPDLGAIAREVGGSDADVTVLALYTQDPHWVDARPHLALALSRADLLIATGAGLEVGWLPVLLTGSRNPEVQTGAKGYLEAAALVPLLDVPARKVDRSEGDIHPQGNPHFTYDPRRVETLAVGIGKRMAELDPEHQRGYFERTRSFVETVRAARKRWEQKLAKARGAKIIGYHRSLAYLADWLGLEVVEHIEPRPGIPPNPSHVAHVLSIAKSAKVRLILQEAWYPDNSSKLIAEKSGARLLRMQGLPNYGAKQSYVAFVDVLVRRLAEALGV
ncbi:MAG TPA: zinc ABC transporter substrate-binding protein [Polyangiaceae bacterium]